MAALVFNSFPRSAWGGSPNSPAAAAPVDQGLVIHWNGPGLGAYSADAVAGIVAGTWRFHVQTNGWSDIAYNYSVDRFGRIWTGRGDLKWNAASGDNFANTRLLAVECLMGEGDTFTDAMKGGLATIAAAYVASGRARKCYGHRDVVATACPGGEVYDFVRLLNQNMGSSTFTPQLNPAAPADDDEEDMPEYLIQATDNTMYAIYPNGRCRVLIYPELLHLQKTNTNLSVVKTTNRENDMIMSHRALLP